VIKKMASVYYSGNHSIREVVRTMLTSSEFYSSATKTGHIKSPTEFVVSAINQLGLQNPDLSMVPRTLTALGQELFNPPNVGGWPGGPSWINPTTMLQRFNFASALTGDAKRAGGLLDAQALITQSGAKTMPQLTSYIAGTLGINPGSSTAAALKQYAGAGSVAKPDIEARVRGLVHLTLISPEYQVS
jgi:uncharacterized protein (DUF1800 family)